MAAEKKSKTWVKDLLVAFAATTLSIILTFGTTMIVNRVNQKKERKLTALMVMSNIESFARSLEETEENMASIDSVATWLLSLPLDNVARLGYQPLADAFAAAFSIPILSHDKTAETIFSSNIETWKNMGNFHFIDNVGACFSQINWIEDYFNEYILEYKSVQDNIFNHPNEYPGNSLADKYLGDELFRLNLLKPNSIRCWLRYNTARLREINRKNMVLIGISEKEVMDFTDERGEENEVEGEELDILDFDKPFPQVDSLRLHLSFARKIDSLLNAK